MPVKAFHRNVTQVLPSIIRQLTVNNMQVYERMLQTIREREDVWITSQGDYMAWWLDREAATLQISVSNQQCTVSTSLDQAVIEQIDRGFVETNIVDCPATDFEGEVWITLSPDIEKLDLLKQILKREGIINFREGASGDFLLTQTELGSHLETIEENVIRRRGKFFEADIDVIRQIIIDKLAARKLPLFRLWYHPKVNGVITQAVFSPRYDVDRAITNMAHIRALELKYDVKSTLYIRAFCPFYSDKLVQGLAQSSWCPELVLHGEFVTTAARLGDEYKAAKAEKQHLEAITGQPILGVGMHGGELTDNRSPNTDGAVSEAGFLYDTTPRPGKDFLPSRKMINGQFSNAFTLPHALGDIEIPVNRDYADNFYSRVVTKMDEIYEHRGVFVLMLHPVYFGFLNYLSKPGNWPPLFKFMVQYVAKKAS
ncbi:MAG: hypothetical protein AAF629_19525 [Chloroflexota bacterium]